MSRTTYIVIYRTATHVAHVIHSNLEDALADEHLGPRWSGRLYSTDQPDFSAAEAKEIYNHGVDSLPDAWGICDITPEPEPSRSA